MKTTKGVLMFAVIATVTAAVALAINGPPRSPQKPVSTAQASASADAPPRVGGTPGDTPAEYLSPRYSRGFRSGCSGGSCCPK